LRLEIVELTGDSKEEIAMTDFTRDVTVLLEEIDKIIIDIETKQIPKSSSNERQIFLEGKAAGLNEAYRMIKRIFRVGDEK